MIADLHARASRLGPGVHTHLAGHVRTLRLVDDRPEPALDRLQACGVFAYLDAVTLAVPSIVGPIVYRVTVDRSRWVGTMDLGGDELPLLVFPSPLPLTITTRLMGAYN